MRFGFCKYCQFSIRNSYWDGKHYFSVICNEIVSYAPGLMHCVHNIYSNVKYGRNEEITFIPLTLTIPEEKKRRENNNYGIKVETLGIQISKVKDKLNGSVFYFLCSFSHSLFIWSFYLFFLANSFWWIFYIKMLEYTLRNWGLENCPSHLPSHLPGHSPLPSFTKRVILLPTPSPGQAAKGAWWGDRGSPSSLPTHLLCCSDNNRGSEDGGGAGEAFPPPCPPASSTASWAAVLASGGEWGQQTLFLLLIHLPVFSPAAVLETLGAL